ncbi:MAG: DAK2 domain-containing protein [Rhodococcus sp.]|nr:DAK2 domain-containing protein [Rhodococcus sp. (in: high G+C Gram-positive bacteria)]
MDGRLLVVWARSSVRALEEQRESINALNVFPVPDSDTGTNLLFTMRAAVSALDDVLTASRDTESPGVRQVAIALARGSVVGARGNSGVILSQVLRGLAEASTGEFLDSPTFATALRMASNLVSDAVSYPVEGTIVTVLRKAADAIAGTAQEVSIADTAIAAADAAAQALERTPMQLDVLGQAGVVDAGGYGLVVVLDALVQTLTGAQTPREFGRFERRTQLSRSTRTTLSIGTDSTHGDAAHTHTHAGQDFEVMYLVSQTTAPAIDTLRATLDELGDSVVIVSDGSGAWSVHVHCRDAGAAVEAGLAAGQLHQIRITSFLVESQQRAERPRAPVGADRRSRGVLAVVSGEGAAELFEGEGAVVLRSDDAITRGQLLGAIRKMQRPEVLVLPNGALPVQELIAVSAAARDSEHEVHLLATSSMVQGLAALAVHDPARDSDDDVFTMSEAAAATRWGSLRIASERALTYVGTCEPGDGLGLVGHEVIVIDPDPDAAVRRLIDLLLRTGGELVTLVLGARAPEGMGSELVGYIEQRHPGVEVMMYEGGQVGDLLQLGVE